jgi:hypothetical protein
MGDGFASPSEGCGRHRRDGREHTRFSEFAGNIFSGNRAVRPSSYFFDGVGRAGFLNLTPGPPPPVLVDELDVGGSFLAKTSRPALTASALAAFEGARPARRCSR